MYEQKLLNGEIRDSFSYDYGDGRMSYGFKDKILMYVCISVIQ
jgi:hypothetical protein